MVSEKMPATMISAIMTAISAVMQGAKIAIDFLIDILFFMFPLLFLFTIFHIIKKGTHLSQDAFLKL